MAGADIDPEEIADELYGVDPNEFVAARDEYVAQAREAGDRDTAAVIGKLRKPTVAAWLVNLLARDRADELAALLDLGDALRKAQRRLSGSDLRKLSNQRRHAVGALEREAGRLAVSRGRRVSEAALREVGQTLNAALADPDIEERVRAGRLETSLEYSGFGDSGAVPLHVVRDRTKDTATEEPEDEQARAAEKEKAKARAAELKRAIADAEAAQAAVVEARAAAERAEQELTSHEARVRELREQLQHAEEQREFARSAAKAAAQDATAAERAAAAANAAVGRLRGE
ncbi:hypothetical protein [Rhodococcus sp. O3]|uniref:hypothetical protein n=1 Tax=Rhodococcus sp. O3 TaxID=3404919 RepID=UPI003B67D993